MPETWTWAPWFDVEEEEVGIDVLVSPGENKAGPEQLRIKNATARLVFRFPIRFASLSEADAAYAFYVARKGIAEAFYWWRPGRQAGDSAVQYTVRFRRPGLTRTWFRAGVYRFRSIEFIEDRR